MTQLALYRFNVTRSIVAVQYIHRQLDYLVYCRQTDSSEKPRGPASLRRFLLTSQWKIIIRVDPPVSRGQKLKVLRSAGSQSAVRISRVSNDLPSSSSLSVKPPGESARGFVTGAVEKTFSAEREEKREGEADEEETSHLSQRYGIFSRHQ